MRGCLGGFLYLFLTLPFVATLLLMIGVVQTAFNRDFFADTLTSDALYDALYSDVLPDEIQNNASNLTTYERANVALALAFSEIVPKEYLKGEVTRIVNETFDFLEGATDTLYLEMDMSPVKAALLGAEGEHFTTTLVANLPVCAGTVETFEGSDLLICKPIGLSDPEIVGIVSPVLSDIADNIPDTLTITEEPILNKSDATDIVGDVQSAGVMSMVLAILTALFVNGIIGGGFRYLFGWMGRMLMVPALMNAAIAAFFAYAPMRGWLDSATTNNSTAFDVAVTDTLGHAVNQIGMGVLVVNMIAVVIAVLFIGLGLISRPKTRTYDDGPIPPSGKIKNMPNSSGSSPISGNLN